VTGHFVQVNGPIFAGDTGITPIGLEMRVDKAMVRTGKKTSRVRNIEGADQAGYVSPRF
jgi:hypothetical protein